MRFLTRAVVILSLVSLFTDMASEMLYPILPVYLQSIGYSVIVIGVIEGFAEAIAGLSKGYFGKMSDLTGKRVPFVRMGYLLSAVSKPLMGLFLNAWWIFGSRMIDRTGKGIRTGARDALLSDASGAGDKGKVFGFHRTMDTLGAVAGPLLALVWLEWHPGDYRNLFFVAFLPGLVAIGLTYLLNEIKQPAIKKVKRQKFFDFIHYWKASPAAYRQLVSGLLLFALFNSSDVFLLLKMKSATGSDADVIYAYVFYNLIYAIAAFPLGIVADKLGMKKVLCAGLLLFAVVYFGMAQINSVAGFMVMLFIYGIYAAATEGIAKAWITDVADKKDSATAIGAFSAFQSLMLLLASAIAGTVWYLFGPEYTFMLSAVAAVVAFLMIARVKSNPV